MIRARDKLELAPGVRVVDEGLRDDVRAITVPLNRSGHGLAACSSIEDMSEAAIALGASRDAAPRDAIAFATALNERLLANVRVSGGAAELGLRWLGEAFALARYTSLPSWPRRRCAVDTSSRAHAARGVAIATAAPAAVGAFGVAAVVAVAGFGIGVSLGAALAIFVGVVAHECGHVLLLRGVPAFVARRGLRVRIVHAGVAPKRAARVAIAGPAAGALTLALVGACTWVVHTPELVVADLALTGHALGLTVLTPDGRRSCAAW